MFRGGELLASMAVPDLRHGLVRRPYSYSFTPTGTFSIGGGDFFGESLPPMLNRVENLEASLIRGGAERHASPGYESET